MEEITIDGKTWVELEEVSGMDKYMRFRKGKFALLEIMDEGALVKRIWFGEKK